MRPGGVAVVLARSLPRPPTSRYLWVSHEPELATLSWPAKIEDLDQSGGAQRMSAPRGA